MTDLAIGSYVENRKQPDWGVGKVVGVSSRFVSVFFEAAAGNPKKLVASVLRPLDIEHHPRLDLLTAEPTAEDGARTRPSFQEAFQTDVRYFTDVLPGGFENTRFLENERAYKLAAHERFRELLSRDTFTELLEAGAWPDIMERMRKVASASKNLLSPFEQAALSDGLRADGPHQERAARALFALL